MQENGTRYLALVQFAGGEREWMVVYWGVVAALSDPHGTAGWVSHGLKLRDPTFIEHIELNLITDQFVYDQKC